jgi:hypothetical protein
VRDPNGRDRGRARTPRVRGARARRGARRHLAAAGRREGERRVARVGPTFKGERGGVRGALGPVMGRFRPVRFLGFSFFSFFFFSFLSYLKI